MTDFEEAKRRGMEILGSGHTIGTLGEKTLHAVLKCYADPDESHHEVRLPCKLIADVYDGTRVTEIQTAGFSRFRKKLERLLEEYDVTVIHPFPRKKWLAWVDPATGEADPLHKVGRVGCFADVGRELIYLVPVLGHPRLTFVLLPVDVEEYRLRDGWGNDGKRGAHRAERIPVALGEPLTVRFPKEWASVLPDGLPVPFTVKEVKKAGRLSEQKAQALVTALFRLGAVERVGKRRNAYLYQIVR